MLLSLNSLKGYHGSTCIQKCHKSVWMYFVPQLIPTLIWWCPAQNRAIFIYNMCIICYKPCDIQPPRVIYFLRLKMHHNEIKKTAAVLFGLNSLKGCHGSTCIKKCHKSVWMFFVSNLIPTFIWCRPAKSIANFIYDICIIDYKPCYIQPPRVRYFLRWLLPVILDVYWYES